MFDVLVNNSKGERIKNFSCPVNECTIGKSRDNFIQLRGWKVANHHAVISRTSEGLFIEDKTGKGSVEVNGEDVEHHGPIRTSDQIVIGGYHIQAGISSDTSDEVDEDDEDAFEDMKTVIGVPSHQVLGESEEISKTLINIQHDEKFKWRNRVHDELLAAMDLRRTDISSMDEDSLRKHVEKLVREIIAEMDAKLPGDVDREKLLTDVLNEAVGLGPLEDLLANEEVTEIMVNKFDEIFIEKSGKLTLSDITFSSDDAVMTAIERIVSPLGRRIDESSPLVDARLKDGSRVNAIIPPLALRGPCLTIRKFAKQKLQAEDLVNFGALNHKMVNFLETAVNNHMNILISGGTGSGKTTLLNVLSNFIPPSERIITVEDAAELKLVQPHLVSLESRPANLEGKGAIPIRDLVKNCLRMRPDRIVVGECRGGETLDMLQAMNTGHDGSLTTAHANTPRDMIARLEVMVMMSGLDLPVSAIREMVASAIHIIVQISRYSDGSRRVTNITEITGVESGIVSMQDVFRYQQEGFDENGKVKGHFEATGAIPHFYEEMRQRGLPVDMSIFSN
ncbi:MAG: FHA domain-containing protein [Gammaproteobacteria bacterium]|nr:FHA domain-containing protein [Gammaproteobacteria bacterium]